jgi:hypothetical protein
MKFNSNALLDDLMADVRQILLEGAKLENINALTMQQQPSPGRWSVAQILEHLNFYSHFYLKAIEDKLHQNPHKPSEYFNPGWFGNYFTNMMKPTENETIKNKMKALKNATPPLEIDGHKALRQFIHDQHNLLNLLRIAKSSNLGKIKVPTSITKLISLKLGDTFRFFIAHEQRHILQIKNTLKQIKTNTS